MSLKVLKRLVHATLAITFWSVAIKAGFPQSASISPYLSFKFSDESKHKGKLANNPVILKRGERLEFQIQYVTNVPYQASAGINYGPLSIRATNQHPDFFKERPGPTVSLEVSRVSTNEQDLLPIRIFSSGEGYSNGAHYLSVSIDILEPERVRQDKISQFVSQLRDLTRASGSSLAGEMNESDRLQGVSAYFNELYISNPPGVYNLKAVFEPDLAVAQARILTATAFVKVEDGPDSLDLLKQKLTEKKK